MAEKESSRDIWEAVGNGRLESKTKEKKEVLDFAWRESQMP